MRNMKHSSAITIFYFKQWPLEAFTSIHDGIMGLTYNFPFWRVGYEALRSV